MSKTKRNHAATAAQASKNLQNLFSEDMQSEAGQDQPLDLDWNIDETFQDFFSEEESEKAKEELKTAKISGVELIDIDLLVPSDLNKFNMRPTDESYKAIKRFMEQQGYLQGLAIIGEKRPDGKVTIISGHRRTKIAKSLGLTQLPITYTVCKDDADRLRTIVRANIHRPDSVMDLLNNYKEFEKLYDDGDFEEDEIEQYETKRHFIANELGVTETKIRNLLFLLSYEADLWELIDLEVVKTNKLRTLHNSRNEYTNYAKVIEELIKTKVLYNEESDLKLRQEKAKEILDRLEKVKTEKKKLHRELVRVEKSISQLLAGELEQPKNEKEKKRAVEAIEKLERLLEETKKKL